MPTPPLNVTKSPNNATGNQNNNTSTAGDADEGGGESSEPANDSNRPLNSRLSSTARDNTLNIPAPIITNKSPTSPSNRPKISVEIIPATPGRTPQSSARPTISSAHPSSQPSAAPTSAKPSSRPQSPHEAVHNWVKAQSPHAESAREHINSARTKSLSKRDSHPISPAVAAGTSSTTAVASATRSRRGSQSSQPDVHMPRQVSAGGGSVSGEEGKGKFSLKDLLSSGPKLSRRNSASSKKSVSSAGGGGGGGGKPGSRPGSVKGGSSAGESALESKYGVYGKTAVGKGATSIVRLAHRWDRTEEKLYAVKEFRPKRNKESQRDYVKKLTAEFCISSALRHPNVVETVDLMQDSEGKWCEVMEFCPGGDLYNAIRKTQMSPAEVECCFKQILQGVGYLHGQGVAHRDLKPENLFFDARGQIKVGDFGASTVFRLPWETTIHKSSGLCGSEPYIAPEQFAQPNSYDARLVDIWACGIVYYCLHFQELPWSSAQLSDKTYSQYAQQCSTPQLSIAGIPFLKSNTSALTTATSTPAPGTPMRQDSGMATTVGSLASLGTPLAMSPMPGTPLSGIPPALTRAERERENQKEQAAHYPSTILHLSPRACRPVLRRMLEPKPDLRVNIEDILKHPWIASIEVCTEQSPPKHIHPAAIAAAAQGGIVSDK